MANRISHFRKKAGLSQTALAEALNSGRSTYERVSFDHLYGQEYRIEYDAQNSFGVPLRGKGYCTVNGASAEWLELP